MLQHTSPHMHLAQLVLQLLDGGFDAHDWRSVADAAAPIFQLLLPIIQLLQASDHRGASV